jgi:hypothetical protein
MLPVALCSASNYIRDQTKKRCGPYGLDEIKSGSLKRIILPRSIQTAAGLVNELRYSSSHHIVALALINPLFQYHPSRMLTDAERLFYVFWNMMPEFDVKDLWYFRVEHVAGLHHKPNLKHFCSRERHYNQVYNLLDEGYGLDLAEMCLGGRPDWLQDDHDIRLCMMLPMDILHLVISGRWDSIALPSPYTKGRNWSTPAWFRRRLDVGLKASFDITQVHEDLRHLDWKSTLHMQMDSKSLNSLGDVLRRFIIGREPDFQDVASWICAVQNSADELGILGKGNRRLTKDPMSLVKLVVLAGRISNTGELKDIMIKSIKASLPEFLVDAFLEEVQSEDGRCLL